MAYQAAARTTPLASFHVANQNLEATSKADTHEEHPLPPPSRHANAKTARDANAQEWVDRTAADLAIWLDRAGTTQTEVASTLSYGRSWLNKLLMGRNEISLADYLMIVELLKEFAPEHPAVKLAQHLRKLPRLRVVPKE